MMSKDDAGYRAKGEHPQDIRCGRIVLTEQGQNETVGAEPNYYRNNQQYWQDSTQ